MEDILLYFSLKYHGQFDLIYKALERKERVDESLKKLVRETVVSMVFRRHVFLWKIL